MCVTGSLKPSCLYLARLDGPQPKVLQAPDKNKAIAFNPYQTLAKLSSICKPAQQSDTPLSFFLKVSVQTLNPGVLMPNCKSSKPLHRNSYQPVLAGLWCSTLGWQCKRV